MEKLTREVKKDVPKNTKTEDELAIEKQEAEELIIRNRVVTIRNRDPKVEFKQ